MDDPNMAAAATIKDKYPNARESAREYYLQSLDIREQVLGKKSDLYANTLHAYGVFCGCVNQGGWGSSQCVAVLILIIVMFFLET